MKHAKLKPKEERRLLRGHVWAYRNEFASLPNAEDGELVDVHAASGRFVGRGFYQATGGIAVRLLSAQQHDIGRAFFAEALTTAKAYREIMFPGANVYRWVHGESDGLPGLAADRYGDVVSMASSCAFYHSHADTIADLLMTEHGIAGVRFETGGAVRQWGAVPSAVEVVFEGVRLEVSFETSQKTGLFLDQRANLGLIKPFVQGRTVLDGHCYAGAWSCTAALHGAAQVLGVDSSGHAIEAARRNAALNGAADRCVFEEGDVGAALARGATYDVVILDPPAFAKTRTQAGRALKRYQALNKDAMAAVAEGGFLITSSCSSFVDREAFLETLKRAATSAQRQAWIVDVRGAAPDHPVLMSMPETAYLKCAVLRIF
jgi:23S rRNA (cytosine1962-C5)-methyltransferase